MVYDLNTTKQLTYDLIPVTRPISLNFHLIQDQKITDKGFYQYS